VTTTRSQGGDQVSARRDATTPAGEEPERQPAGRTSTVQVALTVLGTVAVVAVALDQWTKQLALHGLAGRGSVRTLGGLIYLDLTRNPGAAFSFGTSITFIFPLIAIAISIAILYFARGLRSWPWAVAMGLVLGGAVGNLIDRLFREPGPFRGHVVDFISAFAPDGERFAIFNLADSALTVGVILAIALELFGFRRDGTRAVRTGASERD
jgi:signal peptidase II